MEKCYYKDWEMELCTVYKLFKNKYRWCNNVNM